MNVQRHLRKALAGALASEPPLTEKVSLYASMARPAQDPRHGDYQINAAMPLAKELGKKPRDLADTLVQRLTTGQPGWLDQADVAGPGFVNLRLSNAFLEDCLRAQLSNPQLGVEPADDSGVMVIDFSSPNVAKPMHVGHLRSTILGDALARIHRRLGWTVITDNHLGDWGTQFGMLILGWRLFRDEALAQQNPVGELARLYRLVNQKCDEDPEMARAARLETAKLHAGDPENLALWKTFMPWCLDDLARVYHRLGITFDLQHGESYYQPLLAQTVSDLLDRKVAEYSDGAICVFFPDPNKIGKDGRPVDRFAPAIIRKQDGAFTYATSDLACLRDRITTHHPSTIVYVVDARQSLHFEQLFEIASRWGIKGVDLKHVAFGAIMGKDGRPFKTRDGGTVGLETLLDEAVARARRVVDEHSSDLSVEDRQKVAEVVGIGAVKYADLSQNRVSDYVFDWDKMVSLQGNTATYLQYAYARNRSIFRNGGIDPASLPSHADKLLLSKSEERALGLQLARYPEALTQAAFEFKPNVLTSYLFDTANAYSSFYDQCPVLKAESADIRSSRLVLCELTARVLRDGLSLLGINVVDRL